MIYAQIARLIANQLILFEFCDDDVIDPDSALKAMEMFLADVEAIDQNFLQEIIISFPKISQYYDSELQDFVRDIPETLNLKPYGADEEDSKI